jgi:hypothetical protein
LVGEVTLIVLAIGILLAMIGEQTARRLGRDGDVA